MGNTCCSSTTTTDAVVVDNKKEGEMLLTDDDTNINSDSDATVYHDACVAELARRNLIIDDVFTELKEKNQAK
jgi:hypothetical protein